MSGRGSRTYDGLLQLGGGAAASMVAACPSACSLK